MREGWDDPAPTALRKGVAEFNEGLFFEQHETLEELWHAEHRPVRDFYQGVLQIGVGLHHRRRGNHHGAVTLISKGIAHLGEFEPACQGIDVTRLVREATLVLEELQGLDAASVHRARVKPPVVRWVAQG